MKNDFDKRLDELLTRREQNNEDSPDLILLDDPNWVQLAELTGNSHLDQLISYRDIDFMWRPDMQGVDMLLYKAL